MTKFYIRNQEYSPNDIENLKWHEFTDFNIKNMPCSLFKYFSFKDHSIKALMNNTVYLQTPTKFDDPYDCNIFVDEKTFFMKRIIFYTECCGVKIKSHWNYSDISYNLAMKIYKHISSGKSLETLFSLNNNNDILKSHHEYFIKTIKLELMSKTANENSYHIAINKVISQEYKDIQDTANRFRIACFTQSPFSILMWSHYAQSHQGFCIEYETPFYSNHNISVF